MHETEILIIEDDSVTQSLLTQLLHKRQFGACVCGNGAEGLYHYLQNPERFPVVLLDLMMPEVSGEMFLNVIGSLEARGVMRVRRNIIIETAVDSFAHLKKLAEHPCVHAVCRKPINSEQILFHVTTVLSTHTKRRGE